MEKWRGWNLYTSGDMIRGATRIQNSRIKTENGTYDTTADVPSAEEMKPFKCPNCGGNSYRVMDGKAICEYCDTEFMDAGKRSKPIDITRPAPLPTTITR